MICASLLAVSTLVSTPAAAGWDGFLGLSVSPIDFLNGQIIGVSYEQQFADSKHTIALSQTVGTFDYTTFLESSVAWRRYLVGSFNKGMPIGVISETEQYPLGVIYRTSIAAFVGYKHTTKSGFGFSVELGPSVNTYSDGYVEVWGYQSAKVGYTF